HPAFERHRLPVVAGAAAAKGQRNSMPDGRPHHGGDLLLALRPHHDVRHAILKLRGKHRAVPVEVVGLLANLALVDRRADGANVVAKLLDERLSCHLVPWKLRLCGPYMPATPLVGAWQSFRRAADRIGAVETIRPQVPMTRPPSTLTAWPVI